MPNIYNYIQFVYWDNMFMGILFRKWDHLLVSLPMFIIFFGLMYKIAQKQGKNFLTLGLYGYQEEVFCGSLVTKQPKESIFSRPEVIPHAWFFAVNMLLTLLFANADINSRVASTCPFYFWAVADLIVHRDSYSKVSLANFAIAHNVLYMVLNFVLFTMEVGFL